MKMKKKKIVRIILFFLVAVLLVTGCFGGYLLLRINGNRLTYTTDYNAIYTQPTASFDVGEDGAFTVLKINDTHFFNGTCDTDVHSMEDLRTVMDSTAFDFILVDGDVVEGFTLDRTYDKQQALTIFCDFVEQYQTPWTFAPGNNDGEIDGDNEDVIAFMMQYPHFISGNADNIYGDMQLFVDLTYQGALAHSLAILDSGMRRPKVIGNYEAMQESQVQWLLDGVNERQVPTSAFFHMPTPQFEAAYDNGTAYEGIERYKTFTYVDIPENALFDEMTADNAYISLISCAHQHSNNMCSFYDGRWYQLSKVSGYSAKHHDFIIPSVTLTTIDVTADNTEARYTFEQRTAE